MTLYTCALRFCVFFCFFCSLFSVFCFLLFVFYFQLQLQIINRFEYRMNQRTRSPSNSSKQESKLFLIFNFLILNTNLFFFLVLAQPPIFHHFENYSMRYEDQRAKAKKRNQGHARIEKRKTSSKILYNNRSVVGV